MFSKGRVCIKLAGRDAGKKCVVTKKVDKNYVMIAGDTRARKCNVKHLEPLDKVVELSDNPTKEDLKKALQ